jgi:hypothetical protein
MEQGLQPLEQQLDLPSQSVQGHDLERWQFGSVECGENPEDIAGARTRRDGAG